MVGISVIMPVYNVSNYLENAINSIKNQTFKDVEIICVNDGSTDNSLDVLNKIRKDSDNLVIVNQENSGPGIARNMGIDYATGEYIAFLDSDDIFLDENALEIMYNTAKENDANLVCGNLKWINQDYTVDMYYDYVNTSYAYAFKEEVIPTEEYGIPFAFYKNIFKKELLIQNNILFPDMRAGEDPIFMAKVLTSTDKCYMVPVDLYGYNHSIGGGVNEKIDTYEKKLAYITHFKEIFDLLKKNNYSKILSSYKNEFVRYYLIYSDNMQDKEILEIIKNKFNNFEDYFEKDDFGYFVMDYIINHENNNETNEEYSLIKKCLFEEVSLDNNFVELEELKKYVKIMDEGRYADEENLSRTSYDVLNKIKSATDNNYDKVSEELKELKINLTSEYYDDNAEFLRKYSESRIDIKNAGNESNDVILLECDDVVCTSSKPSWLSDEEGAGMVLNSIKGNMNFTFQCVGDGLLTLGFKGLDYRDKKDNRIPIFIDYSEIIVDGVNYVHGSRVTWHDSPLIVEKEVQDGQIIDVRVKWAPLSYSSNIELFSNYEELSYIVSEGRIDIKNFGSSENDVKILNQKDIECEITRPDWFIDEEGHGLIIESNEGEINLEVECEGDGDLLIEFRSMDYRDENDNRIPVLIKYNHIKIDDKVIIDEDRVSWHDDPVLFEEKVKDGQILNIEAKWSLFNNKYYEVEELLRLKNRLFHENMELRKFRDTVISSNSWKLTSPLRMLKNLGK